MNGNLKNARLTFGWILTLLSGKAIALYPFLFFRGTMQRRDLRLLIVFAAYIFLTAAVAVLERNSFQEFTSGLDYLAFAVFFVFIKDKSSEKEFLNFLVVATGVIIATLVAYLAVGSFSWAKTGTLRFQSVFLHPNQLGYFSCSLAIGAYFSKFKYRWPAICVAGGFIALSLSLGALLALLSTIALSTLMRNKISAARLLAGLLLAAVFFSIFTFIFYERISQTIFSLKLLTGSNFSTGFGGEGSGSWRINYWSALIQYFGQLPFLNQVFGIGAGSFKSGNYALLFIHHDPHNEFIRILLEYGIIGLLVFISVLAMAWRYFPPLAAVLIIGAFLDNLFQMNSVIPSLLYAAVIGHNAFYLKRIG